MSAPRLVKLLAIVLAGAIAVALVLQLGTRTLRGHFDINFDDDRGGPTVHQQRTVETFDAIELRSQADMEVTVGAAQTLTVEAGQAQQPRIVTRVEGHTLIVESAGHPGHSHIHFGSDTPHAAITITLPGLTALRVLGAGRFNLHQLKGEQFDFDIQGAADLRADGAVDRFKLRIEGAAKVNAADLQARTVEVDVDGAGSATVRATESLKAKVDGIGRIVYFGDPPTVDKHVSGLGSIRPGEPPG
jgi:hypothetical protein